MISKVLLAALLSITLFTGCTVKEYVYVKDACPRIEVVQTVPKISGQVDANGCICGEQLGELFNGASMLRQSETYYNGEVSKYNKEFAVPVEAIDIK